jgi:hypothetical protein
MKQGKRKKGFSTTGLGQFKTCWKNFVVRNILAYLADETEGKGKKGFTISGIGQFKTCMRKLCMEQHCSLFNRWNRGERKERF